MPFRGNTRMLLHQVMTKEPEPPRRFNDRIPKDVETICLKAIAKEPDGRYPLAAVGWPKTYEIVLRLGLHQRRRLAIRPRGRRRRIPFHSRVRLRGLEVVIVSTAALHFIGPMLRGKPSDFPPN